MKSVISSILIGIIVSVTIGVPVFKSTCSISNKFEISVLSNTNCCDPATETPQDKVDINCCSLQQFDTGLYYETLVEQNIQLVISFVTVSAQELAQVTYISGLEEINSVLRPPPIGSREILNKIQLYLI